MQYSDASTQCADACRRLGRLFNVEANTTPSEFTSLLFREVEQLKSAVHLQSEEIKVASVVRIVRASQRSADAAKERPSSPVAAQICAVRRCAR